MKNMWGTIIFVAVFSVVIIGFVARNSNEKQDKAKEQKIKQEKRAEIANIVFAMADKYNAVTDWKDNFKGRFSFLKPTYTIEIQNAIINTDGKPILFFSGLNDIVQKNEKYYLYFDDLFGGFDGPEIHFVLEYAQDQVDKVMSQSPSLLKNYAVIAQITHVKKITFLLKAEADSLDSEDISVTITDRPSNVFIANGNCIDLVFVGSHNDRLLDTSENKPKQKTSAWKRIWQSL